MALIYGGITCAICGKEIDLEQPYVATTHFIGDSNDPLWRFSDAAIHQSCYDSWEHRADFSARYEAFKAEMAESRQYRL